MVLAGNQTESKCRKLHAFMATADSLQVKAVRNIGKSYQLPISFQRVSVAQGCNKNSISKKTAPPTGHTREIRQKVGSKAEHSV